MHVLLVEDHEVVVKLVRIALAGHDIQVTNQGTRATSLNKLSAYDVVLVSYELADMRPPELVRSLRFGNKRVRIILLCNMCNVVVAAAVHDVQDFIVKPFHNEELIARINATIAHHTKWPIAYSVEQIEIDVVRRTVKIARKYMPLTEQEYHVFQTLFSNKGKVLTPAELGRPIGKGDKDGNSHVRVLISRIRSKLNDVGAPDLIKTRRREGYTIT